MGKEDFNRRVMSESFEHAALCNVVSATHFFANQLLAGEDEGEIKAFKRQLKKDHLRYTKIHTRNCLFRKKTDRIYTVRVSDRTIFQSHPYRTVK